MLLNRQSQRYSKRKRWKHGPQFMEENLIAVECMQEGNGDKEDNIPCAAICLALLLKGSDICASNDNKSPESFNGIGWRSHSSQKRYQIKVEKSLPVRDLDSCRMEPSALKLKIQLRTGRWRELVDVVRYVNIERLMPRLSLIIQSFLSDCWIRFQGRFSLLET